jgi:phosphatidylserine/phosphatidylglycerophosphate/cardiolipin synthase-like enzyme
MSAPVQVYFSPPGGATAAICAAIGAAQKTILVQAYAFTSTPIAAALLNAFHRGVSVSIILDRSNAVGKYTELTFFRNAGLSPLVDFAHAIAHNKVMIIDAALVITGSFNFTFAAESHNAENCIFIADPALAELYTGNWHVHAAHSSLVPGSAPVPAPRPSLSPAPASCGTLSHPPAPVSPPCLRSQPAQPLTRR